MYHWEHITTEIRSSTTRVDPSYNFQLEKKEDKQEDFNLDPSPTWIVSSTIIQQQTIQTKHPV